MGEESDANSAEPLVAGDAHDRRTHLKRLGLGVAAAGAWVTPQVVGAPRASAGCTPVLRRMQFVPTSCSSTTPASASCVPTDWSVATNASLTFTCSSPNIRLGGSITITSVGCTPVSAAAIRLCTSGSGSASCVSGSISGNTVTFPTIPSPNTEQCAYTAIRIVISCCT
jgi:hypothetical protein